MHEAFNISLLTPVAHPPPLLLTWEYVFSNYTESQKALRPLQNNAYSYPPPVVKHFGPLQKSLPATSVLLTSLSHVIPPLVLFMNHTRGLGILLPGFPAVPIYPIILH